MQAPSSLCPGYEQVESFGQDEDYESEEEVTYVTLDLGDIEPQLIPSSNSYRLIGLDTPTPYLQLHGTIMKGRHELLLGTELLFTDEKDNPDRSKRSVIHVANTEQRIAFQEVTLIPKIGSKDKGKQKAVGASGEDAEPVIDFQPTATEGSASKIDHITGVSVPSRAGRKKKAKAASATPSTNAAKSKRGKGKGKETASLAANPKVTKSAKAKGKEREVFPLEDEHIPMDEDISRDDMYVDD